MASVQKAARGQNLLLTGSPGIGKTTVIMRLAEHLAHRAVRGFYTEEIRKGGHRQGFRAAIFSGQTTILAHESFKHPQRVGRYKVDLAAFERLVLPELAGPCDLMLIDEIGKMECFSPRFTEAICRLLDSATPVIATVAIKGGGLIAQVKSRPDVEIWPVTRGNRDELPTRLADKLGGLSA